jgi:8-oxo-dGTP diphosphatase
MAYHIRVRACALIIHDDSVLLVEYDTDERGVHYNLPAGGVEPGESVIEAVKREANEEASVDVEVGPLALVYEYLPESSNGSAPHGLHLIFDCALKQGSVPGMPERPDPNQTGVKWIPLSELDSITLYPKIKAHIIEYAKNRQRNIEFLEEHRLVRQIN